MRIAVVCTDLGVRVPGDKGASLHLQAITRAFAALGHDVLLVGVAGHGEPGVDVPAVLLPHPGRASGLERERRKLAFVETVVDAVADRIRAFAPDVVYERLSLFGTAGMRLAALTRAFHVVEVNSLFTIEETRWRELHLDAEAIRDERAILSGCDLRVCVSQEIADAVVGMAPGPPTCVVPNGVDAALFERLPSRHAARHRFRLDAERRIAGFTGTLRPWHGLEVAIDMLPLLPEVVLAVAGEGDVRDELAERAARAGVAERVRWARRVDHEEIPTFLRALDVAIAPYPPLDGFAFSPLKLYEYVAAGVPVVASDVGQVGNLLRELRCGVLVEPGGAAALAAGVRAVLDDADGWRRQADAARSLALRNHGWRQRALDILGALPTVPVATP